MFSSEYLHGATSGVSSATLVGSFTGTEGPEVANRLVTAIKIKLGQLNSLQFLTTALSDLVAQFPTPDTASSRIEIFKMENKLMEEWNKAHWTVREFLQLEVLPLIKSKFTTTLQIFQNYGERLMSIMWLWLIFRDFSPYLTNFTGRVSYRKIFLQNLSNKMICKKGLCC